MRTVAIINQKGGCGKTTTAINLAGVLARRGQRTLLVDLDPQSHCAAGLAIPDSAIDRHIGDAMLAPDRVSVERARLVWRVGRCLDLVPSAMRLAGLEAARGGLAALPDRDHRLTLAIDAIVRSAPPDGPDGAQPYDWVIIDCPPSIGLLTFNALRAATEVIIPVETSFFAMKGASKQANTIRNLARRLGGQTPYTVLPTLHEENSPLGRTLLADLSASFGDRMLPVVIRRDEKLREAASIGQPIVDYAPSSPGAQDYARLADWLAGSEPGRGRGAITAEVEWKPGAAPHEGQPAPQQRAEEPEHDPVLSRAAELAARARALAARSEHLQSRLAADPLVAAAMKRFEEDPAGLALAPEQVADRAPVPAPERRPPFVGVRHTPQGVQFIQPAPETARVAIAGDFNNWSPHATPLRWNPDMQAHETTLLLPPGRRQYRLVIDGSWTPDPHNPETARNPFGEINSVVAVRPLTPAPAAQYAAPAPV